MKIKSKLKEMDYKTAYFMLRDRGYTFEHQSYSFESVDRSVISSVMFRTKYPLKDGVNRQRGFYKHLQRLSESEGWKEEYKKRVKGA